MLEKVLYVVLERTFNPTGLLWLKAMRLYGPEEEALPQPMKGESYSLCGAILSPTKHFRAIPDGWDIATLNSRYHAKILTGPALERLVEKRGFKFDRELSLGSLYYTK